MEFNSLFFADTFTDLTRVVLVNAVYFKCSWVDPFEPMLTKADNFYIDKRSKVHVPFMSKRETLRYAHLEDMDAQIVELPYKVFVPHYIILLLLNANIYCQMAEMSFVVVLPKKRTGLAELEEKLASRQLSDLLQLTKRTHIDLFLPKFKVESNLDLTKHLAKVHIFT
jgi:serpin B